MTATSDLTARPQDHGVLFYEDDPELVVSVGSFLAEALRRGAIAITVATPVHEAGFDAALGAASIDADIARATGSLISIDAAATLTRIFANGAIDERRFDGIAADLIRDAVATGREVCAYGEMVALLWEQGFVASAIELEMKWNVLRREVPFSLLCGYRASSVMADHLMGALDDVCGLHSDVSGRPDPEAGVVLGQERRMFLNRAGTPRDARRFVVAVLEGWTCGEISDDAQIVASELVTNAMIHANSPVALTISRFKDVVRIAVEDESPLLPKMRHPEVTELTGRGLRIVSGIAEHWGYELLREGKTIWADLPFAAERP